MPRKRANRTIDHDEANFTGVWRMFGLVFLLSSLLTIFILWRQRQWRGDHQRAIVVVHQLEDEIRHPLSLVVFRPEDKVQILELPPHQLVETPLEYGTYTTDALVGFTQLEDLQWEYLQYTLSLEYGVALDGIVWSTQSELSQIDHVRRMALLSLINQCPSTLAFWDRMKMWLWAQRIPTYQLESTDLNQYLKDDNRLDQTRYDRWAELYLQDVAIRSSDFSVAVHNGTSINGYAKRVARMLNLMGYYVRNVETVDAEDTSRIWHDGNISSWPAQRLRNVTSVFSWKKDKQRVEEVRSEVLWLLGTDQRELFKR